MSAGNLTVYVCVLFLVSDLAGLVLAIQNHYPPVEEPLRRDRRDNGDDSSSRVETRSRSRVQGSRCTQDSWTVTQTVTTTQPDTTTQTVTTTQTDTTTQTVTTTQVVHSTAIYPTPTPAILRDCQELRSNCFTESRVYTIQPDSLDPFDIYCDQVTDGGGWSVLQRREDGSVDFYRNWANYTAGFGNFFGEFWLGLDYISRLTNARIYELRIDLGDFDNQTRYVQYSSFHVGSASTNYTLAVDQYSGTAGDGLGYHSGMQFTTRDVDNDNAVLYSCAVANRGAWWYNWCRQSSLNGLYVGNQDSSQGVTWYQWKKFSSLRFTEMKVRPLSSD